MEKQFQKAVSDLFGIKTRHISEVGVMAFLGTLGHDARTYQVSKSNLTELKFNLAENKKANYEGKVIIRKGENYKVVLINKIPQSCNEVISLADLDMEAVAKTPVKVKKLKEPKSTLPVKPTTPNTEPKSTEESKATSEDTEEATDVKSEEITETIVSEDTEEAPKK